MNNLFGGRESRPGKASLRPWHLNRIIKDKWAACQWKGGKISSRSRDQRERESRISKDRARPGSDERADVGREMRGEGSGGQ